MNLKKANNDDITSFTKIVFHAVAYTNVDSKEKADCETVFCGKETNQILKKVNSAEELVGYIKDAAWSVEN